MAPVPEIVVPVSAAGQHFRLAAWSRETGSEDLLLLVHGLGCSKNSFSQLWSRPEFRDWSLLALDLPGFGRSPRPEDFSYDLRQQARVLASVLDQRASRRVHLVAHSMGGTAALLLDTRMLSRLASLVLVEPRLVAESCGVAAEASRLPEAGFEAEFLQPFRRRVATDPRVSFDAGHADPVAFHRSAVSLMHWAGSGEMLARFNAAPCPAWFVYGADNRHLPELSALPSQQVVEIEAAAHFPMQDNPDAFYGALLVLLNSCSQEQSGAG
ncbi:MAG: alpha/beta fold hydrolase [Gammaproteobacteria bacterium]